jgi:hypothetical protein
MWCPKERSANKALNNDDCVAKINIAGDFSFAHIEKFVQLWIQLQGFYLDEDAWIVPLTRTPVRSSHLAGK